MNFLILSVFVLYSIQYIQASNIYYNQAIGTTINDDMPSAQFTENTDEYANNYIYKMIEEHHNIFIDKINEYNMVGMHNVTKSINEYINIVEEYFRINEITVKLYNVSYCMHYEEEKKEKDTWLDIIIKYVFNKDIHVYNDNNHMNNIQTDIKSINSALDKVSALAIEFVNFQSCGMTLELHHRHFEELMHNINNFKYLIDKLINTINVELEVNNIITGRVCGADDIKSKLPASIMHIDVDGFSKFQYEIKKVVVKLEEALDEYVMKVKGVVDFIIPIYCHLNELPEVLYKSVFSMLEIEENKFKDLQRQLKIFIKDGHE